MRWDSPWLLLLLLVLPVILWRARRPVVRSPAVLWVRLVAQRRALGAAAVRAVGWLPWAALALGLLAIARPQQGLRQTETETRGVDIVLALDVSPSMRAEDFRPRNRLHVAKVAARDFIRQREHDRIGLVGFGGTAFTQCPLTLDHPVLIELLDAVDFGMVEDGTAIGMGLATSVSRLRESRTPSKVIVLLTDGQNNRGAIDPLTGAELAKSFGIKVYTVLVGRGGVVPVPVDDPVFGRRMQMVRMDVDEETMREIAKRTNGRFFRAQDPDALTQIYTEIDRLERAPIRSLEYRDYRDLGPILLGIAALLLLVHGLSTTTWALRTP
ncbi:MAG TPA: VWA domain-containing protein [Candidatus Limnocylindria bacterium]|nr:VWA domain-containing protein [Candidatus Limnocylindria bacterium]